MLYAVIMAGGSGTRFWPESRAQTPKQLLRLAGERTMIQQTVDRLGPVAPPERVLIVTNVRLAEGIAKQLPELPERGIISEPCKRDTAPCIGLAAGQIAREDPDALMAVMPADHVIRPDEKFQAAINYAAQLVEESPQRLVTFGIRPTFAAETFGYIERGDALKSDGVAEAYKVARFREKPDDATAREYLESGNFYWNAGIFVWKAKTILDALAEHQPKMFEHLERICDALGTPEYDEVLEREFTAIEGTSIDYAVMENADDIAVVEAPFEWDDVGTWRSLARLRGTDDNDNTIEGRHIGLDTRGTIVRTDDEHLVVTLGLEDVIVVHTPDATLVANKEHEESIRQVVKLLKEKGWEDYL